MKHTQGKMHNPTINYNGIEFDDVVINPSEYIDSGDRVIEVWSQICGGCQDKY